MKVEPSSWTQAWDLNADCTNAVYTVDEIGTYYEGYLRADTRLDVIADAIDENTETLFRLNVSPTVGGGQCVLCGGSVEAVDAVPVDVLTEEES